MMAGIVGIAVAYAMARNGADEAGVLFYASLAVIVAPMAYRLAGSAASREERLLLVLLFAVAVYAVKVVYSPLRFTFADEFTHLTNVQATLASGDLFTTNPISQITTDYPGSPP